MVCRTAKEEVPVWMLCRRGKPTHEKRGALMSTDPKVKEIDVESLDAELAAARKMPQKRPPSQSAFRSGEEGEGCPRRRRASRGNSTTPPISERTQVKAKGPT